MSCVQVPPVNDNESEPVSEPVSVSDNESEPVPAMVDQVELHVSSQQLLVVWHEW